VSIRRCVRYLKLHALGAVSAVATTAPASPQDVPRCMSLAVPVAYVEDAPEPYRDFCNRNAGSCDLSGPEELEWTTELGALLRETNAAVNASVVFVPDPENSGLEESWDFPEEGRGDCEDFVVEKRRLLVEAGLPSAALTCGIAFHQVQLFPHAVLFVETSVGTFVLDNLHDDVLCWDALPYFYTRRERHDGQWIRFQQP
jgi:predicted transglutaminase-like cysteine proteinase